MRALWRAIRQTAKLFGSHRKLWVPFLVTAAVEACLLSLIWLAPHPPFSKVLAPPIHYFFNERVLHYPWHFWFLYHAMKHTSIVTSILVGAFMSGIACAMVRQLHESKTLSVREALVGGQVRYGTMVLLWLITWGTARGALEALAYFAPKAMWVLWTAIGCTVAFQALFAYTIPAAVFERSKWWKAVGQGVRETLRHPFSTLLVVILPSLAIISFGIFFPPVRILQQVTTQHPEIALAYVAGRLLLWLVADTLLTVTVAHLWWVHRATQPAPAPLAASAVSVVKPRRFKEGPAVA